jgi:hypothetical protein
MLLTSKEEEFKNANKRWRPLMLFQIMIEVGLDGTIYNYHLHRKDSFAEYGNIGKKISEILPAAAKVAFFSAIQRKRFCRTSQ